MMTSYAVTLARRYDGLFTATFPDVPGVAAVGRDDEEALAEASRALAAALSRYSASGDPLPRAASPGELRVAAADAGSQAPLMKWRS